MRIRFSILIIPLVVAACASSAGSPSPAAPSAAAQSEAPSAAASSEAPSAAASSEAPSAPPSEAAASPDPWAAYRDETLNPLIDQIKTAYPQWGDAFNTAAASGATDSDKVVFATAAFKVRNALATAASVFGEEVTGLPECGVEAQTQAQAFIAKLTEDSQDLLAESTTADPDNADAVTELIEEADASATELTTAIGACAS